MPMDMYDYGHRAKYCDTINVYKDDVIIDIVNEFVGKYDINDDMTYFIEKIEQIFNSFNILDSRYITNIGIRYIDTDYQSKNNHYLFLIWKGSRSKIIN